LDMNYFISNVSAESWAPVECGVVRRSNVGQDFGVSNGSEFGWLDKLSSDLGSAEG
jgi:hypothetical protein